MTYAVHADYTYGEQKFGGNAQAITKQRWLHHTSFLWDFDDSNMALLKHPSRVPKYRLVRLCMLPKFSISAYAVATLRIARGSGHGYALVSPTETEHSPVDRLPA